MVLKNYTGTYCSVVFHQFLDTLKIVTGTGVSDELHRYLFH